MRSSRTALVFALAAGLPLLAGGAPSRHDLPPAAASYALEPPSAGGVEAMDRLLHRLAVHRRVLVIGAHPDDEDTQVLSYVARGLGGEAAYLSLSRGEGGQNLLGPDLGVGLGLVRSQELRAARRLDGARQFFTRAFDFGFTRSLDETLQRWPKDALLEDAVRIVRRFRPQAIVSIFAGTSRDGHGQHQAAGVTAREAYRLAGDPAAFPGLAREGLTVWQPLALYQETGYWRDTEATTVVLPTGEVDPLTGRSFYQIAMASRSLNRSQDMGRLQEPGPNQTTLGWVAGGGGREGHDLFAGIDTRLSAIAAEVADPARRADVARRLEAVEAAASGMRRRLSSPDLAALVPDAARLLADLEAARGLVRDGDGGAGLLLDEKLALAQGALAAAARVTLDAVSDREVAAPGEAIAVTAGVWNAGGEAVRVESLALESADGWRVEPASGGPGGVAAGKMEEWKARAIVPADALPTVPYFLQRPIQGDLYDWSTSPSDVRGQPFQPGPLRAVADLTISGARVRLSREVAFRLRDEAVGEVRRPVRAAPAVEVSVQPDLLVWPLSQKEERLEVSVLSNAAHPIAGRLEISPSPGWPAPEPLAFRLPKAGERQFFDVVLRAPDALTPGRHAVTLAARLEDGTSSDLGIRLIDYGYIPRTPMPEPARVAISAADIRFPRLSRVGYVRGAADRVPEALQAVGVPIEILTARDLDAGDLSRFDAIVIGSRAYETDPTLPRANGRLLDYCRNGGLVIVQYQQYPFVQGGFAPYPLEIARPHDRVTDESAKVTLLDPRHPLFTTPNRITGADWEGWIQERGLYFAHAWDAAYTPLLEMADPGGPGLRGSLLVARLGRGRYVYTGLAFFRQLPAGVPGAYRLLANLLAWK